MVARTPERWQTPTWKQELAAAFTDPVALLASLGLTPEQLPSPIAQPERFSLLVPRGFAALMRPGDPRDPLLRQVLTLAEEAQPSPGYGLDPVGDATARRAPSLLQKYSGRALLIATGACAVHCRYCFRRHFSYAADGAQQARLNAALAALECATDISEVILSGGDPLMLDDAALAELIGSLERLPQLKRLRIHSRIPSILPSRITDQLCDTLARSRLQVIVVAHINHPAELSPEAQRALLRLSQLGGPMLNQSVLLRGVNDDLDTLAELSEALVATRALPYYIHVLDPVAGAAHFDVPESEARQLIAALRQCLPGYMVPRLARERPGEGAKTILI